MLSISTEKNDDDLLPVGNCRRTDAITGGMSLDQRKRKKIQKIVRGISRRLKRWSIEKAERKIGTVEVVLSLKRARVPLLIDAVP